MTKVFRLSVSRWATSLLIAFLLTSCGGKTHKPVFQKTKPDTTIDVSKIPNAVPRHETKSRYGNPKSYVVFGQRYYPINSTRGFVERGISSWYGPNFHGKKTSSQEIYDMYKMTAAHKTLPIPSYVEVTNLGNGRKIIVRVNDRGPFHDGRIIDLSYVAATKLDIVKTGTGRVEIRTIDPSNPEAHHHIDKSEVIEQRVVPERTVTAETPVTPALQPVNQPVGRKQLYVQLGAFSELGNAQKLKNRIQQSVNQVVSIVTVKKQSQSFYRVRVGPMNDMKIADQVGRDLNEAGLYDHKLLFQ